MTASAAFDFSPFGNPDGSRANLEEITRGFVRFGNASVWGGLSTAPNDLTARVLVGRKGSGKTHYLRRLQAHASQEPSLYAAPIQQELPTTESIVKYCQWFPKQLLNEKWKQLWRKAIMRSLSSHILCNRHLKDNVSSDTKIRLVNHFGPIIREYKAAVPVYSQLQDIVFEYNTRNSIEHYLNHALWSELEAELADILSSCPPICFYIDAVDEEFETAPMYWLRCQEGLFYETMWLLRDANFGNRLHIVTCVRDIVLSSVYRTENGTKFKGEPHIRVLNWNRKSIEYFLREKLAKLHHSFFLKESKHDDPIVNWLGTKEIENTQRQTTEKVLNYLLRHTRLLPRDIVIMGNLLSEAVIEIKQAGHEDQLQMILRNKVATAARSFGNEQLAICANEMISSDMPAMASHQGYSDVYIGNKEYATGAVDHLKGLISSIGVDRFSLSLFNKAETLAQKLFGVETDVFSVLWRNGLVGYVDGSPKAERHIFHSDDRMDEFSVPRNRDTYVFHPIIIDTVNIKSVGSKVVNPFDQGLDDKS